MRINIYSILVFFVACVFFHPFLFSMKEENKFTTIQIVLEMCYKKKSDFRNITFVSSQHSPGRWMYFAGLDFESEKIFTTKEWDEFYPGALKNLRPIWELSQTGSDFHSEFHEDIDFLGFIRSLKAESKVKLLKQLENYESSRIRIFSYSVFSLMSAFAIGFACKTSYMSESLKSRLGFAGLGLASFVGTLYGLNSLIKNYSNNSWVSRCPNLKQAIEICRNQDV